MYLLSLEPEHTSFFLKRTYICLVEYGKLYFYTLHTYIYHIPYIHLFMFNIFLVNGLTLMIRSNLLPDDTLSIDSGQFSFYWSFIAHRTLLETIINYLCVTGTNKD